MPAILSRRSPATSAATIGRRVVFSSTGDLTRVPGASSSPESSLRFGFLRAATESIFSVLFPSDCRLCQQPLMHASRLPVCQECLQSIPPVSGTLCALCGERLFSLQPAAASSEQDGQRVCGECLKTPPPFVRASAYGAYEGRLRELIHLLKYDQVRPAARVLGNLLAEAIEWMAPEISEARPLVVPVPLHKSKLRQRGFNQSELIARAALKLKPADLQLEMPPLLLIRRRATESQTGLTRSQRSQNVRGAFQAREPERIAGRNILLVDDVFTTGTTIAECARVLRRAGAERIWVATVARVLKSELKLESGQEHERSRGEEVQSFAQSRVRA
jgi:ComF family protein